MDRPTPKFYLDKVVELIESARVPIYIGPEAVTVNELAERLKMSEKYAAKCLDEEVERGVLIRVRARRLDKKQRPYYPTGYVCKEDFEAYKRDISQDDDLG